MFLFLNILGYYCKGININVELILIATLTSWSALLILRSVNISSILYSNCQSNHKYTCSVDNHTYIHTGACCDTYMFHGLQPNLNDAHNHGKSEFLNYNIPIRTDPH